MRRAYFRMRTIGQWWRSIGGIKQVFRAEQ
jgi:hypothetical protein